MTDDRALREARWEVCDLNEAIAWGVHDRSSDIRISVFGREAAELLVEQLNYYEDSRNRHAAALTAARAHGAQEAYERSARACDARAGRWSTRASHCAGVGDAAALVHMDRKEEAESCAWDIRTLASEDAKGGRG